MDLNRFSYYRANPFAQNDFVPVNAMINRKLKQFPSEIPQGQQHYPSKSGKRIYKEKVVNNEIARDNILGSPERYPYENRIAHDKTYSRNLDTIDIPGASSGTRVSESIRNKHKAIEQLKKKNPEQSTRIPIADQSVNYQHEQKRRQLAMKFQKDIQMRKTKQSFTRDNSYNQDEFRQGNSSGYALNQNASRTSQNYHPDERTEYERYVHSNSNQKYQSVPSNAHQFEGFQRYKRPQGVSQTIDHYNYGRIPQHVALKRQDSRKQRNQSNDANQSNTPKLTPRNNSIQTNQINHRSQQHPTLQNQSYVNNSQINVNNRYRSNPQYVQIYPNELQKRVQQTQKNKFMEGQLKNIYQNDKGMYRKNNPTHLSFSIAAKNSLMGPII